jgi:hypothetical protein
LLIAWIKHVSYTLSVSIDTNGRESILHNREDCPFGPGEGQHLDSQRAVDKEIAGKRLSQEFGELYYSH